MPWWSAFAVLAALSLAAARAMAAGSSSTDCQPPAVISGDLTIHWSISSTSGGCGWSGSRTLTAHHLTLTGFNASDTVVRYSGSTTDWLFAGSESGAGCTYTVQRTERGAGGTFFVTVTYNRATQSTRVDFSLPYYWQNHFPALGDRPPHIETNDPNVTGEPPLVYNTGGVFPEDYTLTSTTGGCPSANSSALNLSQTYDQGWPFGGSSTMVTIGGLTAVNLASVKPDTDTVLGGDTLTGTVTLDGPAPSGGAVVGLKAEPIWPSSVPNPPKVVSSIHDAVTKDEAQVTVPAGQTSAKFEIKTEQVKYALGVKLSATYPKASTTPKTDKTLVVLPPPVGESGPQADQRVQDIINEFLDRAPRATSVPPKGPKDLYVQARDLLNEVRNSTTLATEQDIYLAAAGHYFDAAKGVLVDVPGPIGALLAKGAIRLYEDAKSIIQALAVAGDNDAAQFLTSLIQTSGSPFPPSPPTPLAIKWADQGVTDALRILAEQEASTAKSALNDLQSSVNAASLPQTDRSSLSSTLTQVQNDLSGSGGASTQSTSHRAHTAAVATAGLPDIPAAIQHLTLFIQQVQQLIARGLLPTEGPAWIAQAQSIIQSLGGEVTSVDVSPPSVTKTDITGPPRQLQFAVQDTGSGLASILVTASENVSVHIPSFSTGTKASVTILVTQTDESKPGSVSLKLTDVAGNVATSSGALPAAASSGPPPTPQSGDTVPPTCTLSAVAAGPPPQITLIARDTGTGLASVLVTASQNASVTVPSFTAGTTAPVLITVAKIDPSKPGSITLKLTDVAGNASACTQRITLQPNSARLSIQGQDGEVTIGVGDCVTLRLEVLFQGVQTYTDVTQDANTTFLTDPVRGTFTSKNVWCASAQEANKDLTIYGRYRDPETGVMATGTVHVKVRPQ